MTPTSPIRRPCATGRPSSPWMSVGSTLLGAISASAAFWITADDHLRAGLHPDQRLQQGNRSPYGFEISLHVRVVAVLGRRHDVMIDRATVAEVEIAWPKMSAGMGKAPRQHAGHFEAGMGVLDHFCARLRSQQKDPGCARLRQFNRPQMHFRCNPFPGAVRVMTHEVRQAGDIGESRLNLAVAWPSEGATSPAQPRLHNGKRRMDISRSAADGSAPCRRPAPWRAP